MNRTARRSTAIGIPAALAVLGLGALDARAQAFVAGSLGQSHWSETPCDSRPCDKNETAGTLRAGYRFSPWLGVEARYFDLGSITAGTPYFVLAADTQFREKVSARGAGVNAIATWPATERISISGIAGVAWTEAKWRSEVQIAPTEDFIITSPPVERTTRSTRPYYGISVGYSLTPAWMLSLEAERYRPNFGDTVPIDLYAVGVTYRFR